MAMDTASKRNSAIYVTQPWRLFLPVPDGSVGQPDRQHVPWLYSGIPVTTPVVVPNVRIRAIQTEFQLVPIALSAQTYARSVDMLGMVVKSRVDCAVPRSLLEPFAWKAYLTNSSLFTSGGHVTQTATEVLSHT